MVFTNKYAKEFLEKFPGFKNSKNLQDAIELFENDKGFVSMSGFFFGLTYYFVNELNFHGRDFVDESIAILNEVESILEKFEGSQEDTDEDELQNEVCVSFLENLQNNAAGDPTGRKYAKFIPFLGYRSRLFCKYWDTFTDGRSPGLWTDEEWENRYSLPFLGPNTEQILKSKDISNNTRTPGIWTDEEWNNRNKDNK
jgi:hypothetical protein